MYSVKYVTEDIVHVFAGAESTSLLSRYGILRADPDEAIASDALSAAGKSSFVFKAGKRDVTFDVKEYSKDALVDSVGVVPQRAVLFSGSIRDNMKWGCPDATDEEINNAIAIAQARTVVDDKGGLDARVEAGGKNFSGGQRQRLTIARALVKNPDILILDDSASALDFATDASLRQAISNSGEGRTTFIVSQRASSVMHADKIIVLDDGMVAGIGKHDELLRTSAVYKVIYDSQFAKEVS